jgi:hypothetical protein
MTLMNRTETDPLSLEEVIDSGFYKAMLIKGARIYDFREKSYYKIPKKVFVHLFKKTDHQGFLYLLNKDLKLQYVVSPKYVEQISNVTNLNPNPETFLTYSPPPKKVITAVDEAKIHTYVQASYIYPIPVFYRDYSKLENIDPETSFQLSIMEMFDLKTENQIGFGITAQQAKFIVNDNNSGTFNSIDLNLYFATDIHPKFSKGLRYIFSITYGAYNKLEDELSGSSYSFDSQAVQVQYEFFAKKQKNVYRMGVSLQRRFLYPEKKYPGTGNFPRKLNQDIIGLYASWGFENRWF